MKIKIFFFSVLLLLSCVSFQYALDPGKPVSLYIQDYWETEDGLPQLSIMHMAQTADGYLWFATQEGLARFNGQEFEVFDQYNTPQINRNYIRQVIQARDGTVWIGTDGGGVTEMKDGIFHRVYTREDGLPTDHINHLLEMPDGSLWIGTYENGLVVLKDGKITPFPLPGEASNRTIDTILLDRDGSTWIGTDGAGLIKYANNRFTTFTIENGLTSNQVTTLMQDHRGRLWIGTATGGLLLYDNGTFQNINKTYGLKAETINALLEDSDGNTWIGSEGDGLFCFRDETVIPWEAHFGLQVDTIYSLFEDGEKNVWVGTNGDGLIRLKDAKFTVLDRRWGFSRDLLFPTLQVANGDIYVGTAGGGLNRARDGKVTVYDTTSGLPHDMMFTLTEGLDGSVWIGTYGAGICRFKDGVFTTYNSEDGLANNFIWSIYADSRGAVWVGTRGSGLNRFKDGKFTHHYNTGNGLGNDRVSVMLEDSQKNLWVGTYGGGLNLLQNNKITALYTKKHGLADNIIMSLYEDAEGVLWIGTDGGGLTRYKNNTFVSIAVKDGLHDNLAYQILEDDSGYLWMSCNKGIYRVPRKDLNDFCDGRIPEVKCDVYGKADGMKTVECNGVCQPAGMKTKDGRLWFPSQKGLVMFDPNNLMVNKSPPPVVIEKFIVNSKPVDFRKPIRLEPGSKNIEIHYAGLSYTAPEKVQYRYLLEGYEDEYTAAGNRQTAFYTHLPPGSYHFRVIACNNDRVWNQEGVVITFIKDPYFHQTLWFLLVSGLALALMIFGVYRLRIRQLKKREEELETLVDRRTGQLTRANKELEKQRKKAEAANMAKTEFLARMSHEIRTPMNSIIGFTEMMLDTGLSEEQMDYAKTINRSGDALVSILDDIMDLSKIEAGELSLSPLEFAPGVTAFDICDMIIPRIDPRQVEILCRIGDDVPPFVRQDPGRFRQVLINLMGNAAKFTRQGEIELSLDIEQKESDRLLLHCKVRDTGIGIPRNKLKTIFDAFQQADGTITREYGGTGLGLAICRQIAKLMGGDIRAESETDKGSVFHFTAWMEKSDKQPTETLSARALDGKKVLLVDDNATNLEILEHLLQKSGMTVKTVTRGEKVLPLIQECARNGESFDICVLDAQMPYMNGYEVAANIRLLDPPLSKLPLIAFSSSPLHSPENNGKSVFDGFLAKPVRRGKLLRMIHRLLESPAKTEKRKTDNKVTTDHSMEMLQRSVCILLAEDNPINQKLARTMLTRAGYQLELAENGREAVEMYTAAPNRFDLILMDIQMPKMDGKEATRIIRSAGFYDVPIIALTAESMKGDREKCLAAGMNDYIPKPIKRDKIFRVIRKWVFGKE